MTDLSITPQTHDIDREKHGVGLGWLEIPVVCQQMSSRKLGNVVDDGGGGGGVSERFVVVSLCNIEF
jgi:hypothetical protein